MKLRIIIICLALGFSLPSLAVEKPVIALRVTLNESLMRGTYMEKIPNLERTLAERIALHLNSEVPIFRFDIDMPADNSLVLDFVRTGTSSLYGLDFRLRLEARSPLGVKTDSLRKSCVKYLTFSELIKKDDPGRFIADLEKKFKDEFKRDEMIKKLFSHIMIENFATPDFTNKQWRLKCTHEEVRMASFSRFLVIQEGSEHNLLPFNAQVISYLAKDVVKLTPRPGETDPSDFVKEKCKILRGIRVLELFTSSSDIQPTIEYP